MAVGDPDVPLLGSAGRCLVGADVCQVAQLTGFPHQLTSETESPYVLRYTTTLGKEPQIAANNIGVISGFDSTALTSILRLSSPRQNYISGSSHKK